MLVLFFLSHAPLMITTEGCDLTRWSLGRRSESSRLRLLLAVVFFTTIIFILVLCFTPVAFHFIAILIIFVGSESAFIDIHGKGITSWVDNLWKRHFNILWLRLLRLLVFLFGATVRCSGSGIRSIPVKNCELVTKLLNHLWLSDLRQILGVRALTRRMHQCHDVVIFKLVPSMAELISINYLWLLLIELLPAVVRQIPDFILGLVVHASAEGTTTIRHSHLHLTRHASLHAAHASLHAAHATHGTHASHTAHTAHAAHGTHASHGTHTAHSSHTRPLTAILLLPNAHHPSVLRQILLLLQVSFLTILGRLRIKHR